MYIVYMIIVYLNSFVATCPGFTTGSCCPNGRRPGVCTRDFGSTRGGSWTVCGWHCSITCGVRKKKILIRHPLQCLFLHPQYLLCLHLHPNWRRDSVCRLDFMVRFTFFFLNVCPIVEPLRCTFCCHKNVHTKNVVDPVHLNTTKNADL